MYTLICDVPITRKKRLHHVLDEKGERLFSSHKIGDCVTWVYDQGHYKFNLNVGDDTLFPDFQLQITKITNRETQKTFQVKALK